jgi:hypothetical protein
MELFWGFFLNISFVILILLVKYFFDEKSVDFLPSCVVVNGFLSDDKENVGRVALEFIPQNEK